MSTRPNDTDIQKDWFEGLRKKQAQVSMQFRDGRFVYGFIQGFDQFTILLRETEGREHIVFKHALSKISSPPLDPKPSREQPKQLENRNPKPLPQTRPQPGSGVRFPTRPLLIKG